MKIVIAPYYIHTLQSLGVLNHIVARIFQALEPLNLSWRLQFLNLLPIEKYNTT